ncbi:MAG: DUF167 domain-containing protein [archaeon]
MRINVKVHANSSRVEIKKIDDFSYEIWITKKPDSNRANAEVVKILKKYFEREVEIKSGFSSRNKIIEVI